MGVQFSRDRPLLVVILCGLYTLEFAVYSYLSPQAKTFLVVVINILSHD